MPVWRMRSRTDCPRWSKRLRGIDRRLPSKFGRRLNRLINRPMSVTNSQSPPSSERATAAPFHRTSALHRSPQMRTPKFPHAAEGPTPLIERNPSGHGVERNTGLQGWQGFFGLLSRIFVNSWGCYPRPATGSSSLPGVLGRDLPWTVARFPRGEPGCVACCTGRWPHGVRPFWSPRPRGRVGCPRIRDGPVPGPYSPMVVAGQQFIFFEQPQIERGLWIVDRSEEDNHAPNFFCTMIRFGAR